MRYKFRPKHKTETKEKIREARLKRKRELGYINSPETRNRMSIIKKNMSEEYKRKLSEAKKGKNHPNWKGGISPQIRKRNAPRSKPEKCEVCGRDSKISTKGLHYDHDHKTGKFRGWICFKCNVALGMVGDNIDILRKLINYLSNNEIKQAIKKVGDKKIK